LNEHSSRVCGINYRYVVAKQVLNQDDPLTRLFAHGNSGGSPTDNNISNHLTSRCIEAEEAVVPTRRDEANFPVTAVKDVI